MTSYIDLLKAKQLTVTPQRLEIVNILSSHGHLNIDELYKLLLTSFPSISLATVYKNINKMLEKLFLSEVQVPNKKNVYELIKEEHAHVVWDIDLDTSLLVKEAQNKSSFILDAKSIVLSGACKKCQ